jgi:Flp pilus assembly pilin Flp
VQAIAGDEMVTTTTAIATWNRFRSDESGQDIVEYALLGALVGIASILIWQALVVTVGNVYGAADADVQIRSSCTPDPISAGGGCS